MLFGAEGDVGGRLATKQPCYLVLKEMWEEDLHVSKTTHCSPSAHMYKNPKIRGTCRNKFHDRLCTRHSYRQPVLGAHTLKVAVRLIPGCKEHAWQGASGAHVGRKSTEMGHQLPPSCFQRGQCFSLQIRAQQGAQEGLRGRAAHMCSRGQCKGCA
eukprot:1152018-Pelagomonas_calceolata.AAC.1